MAHGWNTCYQTHTSSSDSRTLGMPLDSEENLANHIERLIEQEDLSSMIVSQEISPSDSNTHSNTKSDSVEQTCFDLPWQGEIKPAPFEEDLLRERIGSGSDFTPDKLALASDACSVLVTDANLHDPRPDPALLTSAILEEYSDVSSCSEYEPDLNGSLNSGVMLNPEAKRPTESHGPESTKELSNLEWPSPSFHGRDVYKSPVPDDKERTPQQDVCGSRPSETISECGSGDEDLNDEVEGREQGEGSLGNLEQDSNISTPYDENEGSPLRVEGQGEKRDLSTQNSGSPLGVNETDCEASANILTSHTCAFESNDAVRSPSTSCGEGDNGDNYSKTINDNTQSSCILEVGTQTFEPNSELEIFGTDTVNNNVTNKDGDKDFLDASHHELEHSSFEFLESCFGFKNSECDLKTSLDNKRLNSNEETDFSVRQKVDQSPQENLMHHTEPPTLVKAGFESTSREQDHKAFIAAGDQEPPVLSACNEPHKFSQCKPEVQNDQIKTTLSVQEQGIKDLSDIETTGSSSDEHFLVSGVTEDYGRITGKILVPLLSSQTLRKRLQPIVLLKTSEQSASEVVYHCAECQETAQSLDQLIEHHHSTHSQHNFQLCRTCGCYLTDDALAGQHVCGEVEQDGPQSSKLLNQSKQYPKQLTTQTNYKHKCRYCGMIFMKLQTYQKHEHRHKAITPYRCNRCGLHFVQCGSLHRHKRETVCLPLKRAPQKPADGRSESSPRKLTVKPLVLPTDSPHDKLPDCFVKLVDFRKKKQSPLPISCQVCGKNFMLRAQFNSHLRTHTDEKPFQCENCLKAFKYPWNLNRHKKDQCTGSDMKPETTSESTSTSASRMAGSFKCPICPRIFKYSYNRFRHLRDQCIKEYTQKGNGKVGNAFKCPLCSSTFTMACNRKRHIRKTCFQQYKHKEISKMKKEFQEDREPNKRQRRLPVMVPPTQNVSSYFKCKLCPALFAHNSGLYRHTKKHKLSEKTGKPVKYRHGNPNSLKLLKDTDQRLGDEGSPEKAGNQSFSCRFCGKCFGAPYNLKKHMHMHKGDRPYRCLDCGKSFARHSNLTSHKKTHQRRIQCSVCKKNFPTIGDLLKHRQSHITKGMLQCPDCPMQFKFPVYLLRHVATNAHKQKSPLPPQQKQSKPQLEQQQSPKQPEGKDICREEFMCAACQKVFKDSEALSKHCLDHMPKPSASRCQFCKRSFQTRASLIRHIRLHTGEKPFPCEGCGMRFYRKDPLQIHREKCTVLQENQASPRTEKQVAQRTDKRKEDMKFQEVKKPYKCLYCPHAFVWASSLTKHMRAHKSKTVFPCSKCGKYYRRNIHNSHEMSCAGIESTSMLLHACKICGKTFSRKDNRNVHEKKCVSSDSVVVSNTIRKVSKDLGAHGKDKLHHRCPHCSKKFRYRSFLLRHLPAHTGEKPHTCMHCGHRYASRHRYLQHEAFCDGVLRELRRAGLTQSMLTSTSNLKDVKLAKGVSDGEFKCKFCTKTFARSRNLRRHILTHTEVKPYRCKTCESCFSRYDHLKLHQTRCRGKRQRLEVRIVKISLEDVGTGWQTKLQKQEKKMLDCNICSKHFTSKTNLARHITMQHTSDESLTCKRCGNSFAHQKSLRKHNLYVKCKRSFKITSHSAKGSDSVHPCRETSKLLQRIQGHYSDKLKYQCAYCPRRFKDAGQLKVHTRLHTGEKPFGCADCGERFIRRDYLQRHLIKCNSKGDGLENILCDKCGDLFTQDALRSHQRNCVVSSKSPNSHPKVTKTSSPQKIKGFSCANCSERFLLFSQLQQHFLSKHRGDSFQKPYEGVPHLQQQLSSSMNIKEEPLDEGYDEGQLRNRTILTEDTASEGKKPCVCPHCNMRFQNKGGLGMHMRTHSGVYPLSCQKCHKGFWSRNVQRKHQRKCNGSVVGIKEEPNLETAMSSESESTLNDTVLVFNRGSKTTGTGVLQTKFSCKDQRFEDQDFIDVQEQGTSDKGNALVHKYQCSECDQSFTDGLRLISHLEDHGREEQERKLGGKHCCRLCGKGFGQAGVLQRHMRTQHGEKMTNICPDCFKSFRYPSDLDLHRSCHDPNRPFVCIECKLRFWSSKALSHHHRHAHSGLEHKKEVATHDLHQKAEKGSPKGFTCQPCNRTYALKTSFLRHCRLKHKKRQEKSSDHKSETVSSRQEIDIEVNIEGECDANTDEDESDCTEDSNDSDSAPYFPCHVCGKTFPTSESLEDHQRCHLGEKPHECAECGKCFIQLANLQQHQRSHKSEFQCQTCGRGFVSLFALRKHKHTHGKSRPHRCTKCHLSFGGPSQLAEHMETHRDENFPCDLCDRTFSCKISRAEHRKIHTEPEEELPPLLAPSKKTASPSPLSIPASSSFSTEQFKYRCGICNERFRDPEQLSEHGCNAAKERPYSCPECNQHFLHGSHLKKHQLSHQLSGSFWYQCNRCHMSFSYRNSFLNHLKKHGNEEASDDAQAISGEEAMHAGGTDRIYKCPICPHSFAQAMELAGHLSVHSYVCHVCSLTFASKKQLAQHEQCHLTAATQYECTECGESFMGSDAFRQHHCARRKRSFADHGPQGRSLSSPSVKRRSLGTSIQGKNDEEEEEVDVGEDFFNCSVCDKRFSSKSSLQEHQKQHPDERPFKCLVCGKGFAKKRYVSKHQQIHGRPYRCDLCPQSFLDEISLFSHKGTHNENRKHQCPVCNKTYLTAYDLLRHERRHPELQSKGEVSGEHRCDMCYKSFNQLSQLRQHQESHVGQVVYECTECDKAFAFFHLLEEHQQTHVAATETLQSSSHPPLQSPNTD